MDAAQGNTPSAPRLPHPWHAPGPTPWPETSAPPPTHPHPPMACTRSHSLARMSLYSWRCRGVMRQARRRVICGRGRGVGGWGGEQQEQREADSEEPSRERHVAGRRRPGPQVDEKQQVVGSDVPVEHAAGRGRRSPWAAFVRPGRRPSCGAACGAPGRRAACCTGRRGVGVGCSWVWWRVWWW